MFDPLRPGSASYELRDSTRPNLADNASTTSSDDQTVLGGSVESSRAFGPNYDNYSNSSKHVSPAQAQSYDDNKEYHSTGHARQNTGISSIDRISSFYHNPAKSYYFVRDWWLELIGCLFLLGGLVAILLTAYYYQDRPLPHLPQGLSINSVLAIYTVILKAAMLLILAQGLSHLKWTWFRESRPLYDLARYDNASRGPLGSLWLLFTLRGRDVVSSVGTILIVAAVILDPMAQQVIRYYNCSQVDASISASIPRTNAFMELGARAGAGLNTVSRALQSAVNGGLFVPGSQVGFNCPTGNCTFSTSFHTVGYATSCVDISNQLTFRNISSAEDDATTLQSILPSGLSTNYNQFSSNVTFMAMQYNSSTSTVELILGPQVVDPQASHAPYCTASNLGAAEQATNWNCRGWGAARCTLAPSVFTISAASVNYSQLQENISLATVLNTPNAGFAGNSYTVADLTCLSTKQKASLTKLGYKLPSNTTWLAYNVSLELGTGNLTSPNPNATTAELNLVPKECIYQIYGPTVNSLGYFLSDYLTGTITTLGTEYTGPTVMQQFYNNRGTTFDSVQETVTNITDSITTYIRQNGFANNSAPATGTVQRVDTCIRVRWALLAYPAALALLTMLFFVAMVLRTRQGQQGVHHDFKSSPLALLFHGLEDETKKKVERVHGEGVESNEVADLKSEARGMWVRLRPTGKGWKFVTGERQ